MNYKLAHKCVDKFEKEYSSQNWELDMGTWCYTEGPWLWPIRNTCGTTLCFAGAIYYSQYPDAPAQEIERGARALAKDYLDMSEYQADKLFILPYWEPDAYVLYKKKPWEGLRLQLNLMEARYESDGI